MSQNRTLQTLRGRLENWRPRWPWSFDFGHFDLDLSAEDVLLGLGEPFDDGGA